MSLVPPVRPDAAARPPASTALPSGSTGPPLGDFEAALGRAVDPRGLDSVSIDDMLRAYAASDGPVTAGGVQAAAGAVELLGPGAAEAWAGARVLAAGERYLGIPYVWGGDDPATGFDCSGLVQQVFADVGVDLPRVSADQARAGRPVAGLAEARPGDLIYWAGDGSRPNHIGIYADDDRMLVAPRTGDVVRYQDITREPDAVRRVL